MKLAKRITMKLRITIAVVLWGLTLMANAGSSEHGKAAPLRALLSEVQPGALGSDQYCMLIFDDHSFHAERAYRKRGKDEARKVYEGQLPDADWNALTAILDAKPFRDLHVPPPRQALVIQDVHPYTISVLRQDGFQNMEFLNKEGLKPYESEVKPLLEWWKATRKLQTAESTADVDSRCALTGAGIFNN